MPSYESLQSLADTLSSNAQLLSDPDLPAFQARLETWSEIDRSIPGAIVLPQTEDDCHKTVKWAISTQAPFTCKSGGMSLYSTINQDGIIIDLSNFASIQHDKERDTATLYGGISTKAAAVALAKDGFCTTLPSANPVGAVPFFLNGGNSPLVSKLGYGSDNLLSARMITASGELVVVSEDENPELLYAIRGAGQYFGLVTALTVRTHPIIEILGTEDGTFWSGRFIFPVERAKEVSEVMENIVNNEKYCTGGLIMIAAPPPARKPAVVVTARLVAPDSGSLQQEVFEGLYDLKPLMSGGGPVRVENNGDATEPLCVSGDFKKLRLTGIHSYDPSTFPEIVGLWQQLAASCPDAAASVFSIQWESQPPRAPSFSSATSMHNIRFWANNMTWCTDAANEAMAQRYLEQVIKLTRSNQKPEQYVDFANSLREPESPVHLRYKGEERLERLKAVKRQWDPEGRFGMELL